MGLKKTGKSELISTEKIGEGVAGIDKLLIKLVWCGLVWGAEGPRDESTWIGVLFVHLGLSG